ncbi:MAG: TonB-dependent receptor [Opitutaceae bacterium]|nr:TonB-dependent receptor [Opitutaceae bacterium]
MTYSSLPARTPVRMFRGLLLAAFGFLALTLTVVAAESTKKAFDLPAADAVQALKAYTDQSGEQIVYPVERVRGVKTNAVKGEYSAREALDLMLASTGLSAVQDASTGALAVRRDDAPNGPRAAQSATARDQATDEDTKLVKLEAVEVLGSRIRQTEFEGPSPVSNYNNEYIRNTGAMTLADFLNRIPQAYSGIATGRGSAPDEFNPEFGTRTETSSPAFNFVLGASAAIPTQTGVSGVSLRGLGAGSTLVLVDGRRVAQSGSGNRATDTRQGFVDLNTIPLGMIERIEVITDGASAIYGADAVAGVINIVLKKNYTGTEISGGYKASEHGGGRERNASVTTGFAYGKLSGTVSLDYYDRQNLAASDRVYSKHQDHSAQAVGTLLSTGAAYMGRNYTLNWGYPAVIQASGGTVSGNFNAIPGVRVVAVPVGSNATPTIAQFLPITTPATGTIVNSSGQRRMNTAEFLDLIPKSERLGANASLKYRFNDKIEAYASYRTSESKALSRSQPTTSITGGFGSAVLLPAAFNPFNQNVNVGMVLAEWGSTSQDVRTVDDAINAGVLGRIGTWQYDLGISWQEQGHKQITRNFHGPGLANLLINADPAQRFNPFIDYTASGAPSQFAILDTLTILPSVYSTSNYTSVDFTADGDLFDYWGGTIKLAVGGTAATSEVWSRSKAYSTAVIPVVTESIIEGEQDSNALFAEFFVPVFGKQNARPGFQRLDFQLAGRYEENGPFNASVPKIGASWSPVQSVLLRASWSEGFRAPGVTEYLVVSPNQTLTLTDPRRTPPSTTGVVVSRGSSPTPEPEWSETSFAGVVYEPEFAPGLSLQANYYDTQQKDVLQIISAQNIINNEALFPERVTRAPASAADIALNQPGQITGVNQTFINFGRVVNRSMDIVADYVLPWDSLGRIRINLAASRTLESTRQVAPGQLPVVLEEDTGSPPKWKYNTAVFWSKGSWNAAAFLWYMDGFETNNAGSVNVANSTSVTFYPTPSVTKLDLRAGYEFKNGLWRGYGKNLRVSVGVNNVFDKEPPFSDTLWGFNAGLHSQLILGRAYEFSFLLPF